MGWTVDVDPRGRRPLQSADKRGAGAESSGARHRRGCVSRRVKVAKSGNQVV